MSSRYFLILDFFYDFFQDSISDWSFLAPLIGSRVDGLVGTSTLICECNEGYTGEHCDTCAPGYFGNPHQIGGSCHACECNGRIDTTDPDACDATTGECLKCKFNRASPDCLECADGYYEDNGECVPCNCDINGSSGDIVSKTPYKCTIKSATQVLKLKLSVINEPVNAHV